MSIKPLILEGTCAQLQVLSVATVVLDRGGSWHVHLLPPLVGTYSKCRYWYENTEALLTPKLCRMQHLGMLSTW